LLGAWMPLKRTLLSSLSEWVCLCGLVDSNFTWNFVHRFLTRSSRHPCPASLFALLEYKAKVFAPYSCHRFLLFLLGGPSRQSLPLMSWHRYSRQNYGRAPSPFTMPRLFQNWRTWQPHTHGVLCLTGLLLPEPPLSLTLFASPGWFGWVG
jgi:hypothetical protein